jgi:hypothetical protein
MINFVDENDITCSREEREFFEYLISENEDASKRHRIPVRAWDAKTEKFRKAFFYEPLDNVLTALLSELSPLYFKSQVSPECRCSDEYQHVSRRLREMNSCSSLIQVTQQGLIDLKDKLPRTVWRKVRALEGQYFLSYQDAADELLNALQFILSEDQLMSHGNKIIQHLSAVGVNDEFLDQKRAHFERLLKKFHGNVPSKPIMPTEDRCPFCHAAYKYSFAEWLIYDLKTFERVKSLLIGDIPIPVSDIERCLQALEVWLFCNNDAEIFQKKMSKKTIAGSMFQTIHLAYQEIKEKMLSKMPDATPDDSQDSASNFSVMTSVPPVPDIPGDS